MHIKKHPFGLVTSFYNIYSSIFQIFLSSYDDECLRLCNSHCLSGKACSTKYDEDQRWCGRAHHLLVGPG